MSFEDALIEVCPSCSKKNRVYFRKLVLNKPRCGHCKSALYSTLEDEVYLMCLGSLKTYYEYVLTILSNASQISDVLDDIEYDYPHQLLINQVQILEENLGYYSSQRLSRKLDKLRVISSRLSEEMYTPYSKLYDLLNKGFLVEFFEGAISKEGAAGAAIGASIGSFVPIIGTGLGGVIGAFAGGNSIDRKKETQVKRLWETYTNKFDKYFREVFHYYDEEIASELKSVILKARA